MTVLFQRHRRLSSILDQLKSWTNVIRPDRQYRSLSTGDLVTTPAPSSSISRPSEFEPDFVEMDFGRPNVTLPTKKLPAHYDDCDLVPMEFTKKGVKLIPQGSSKAKNVKKYGSNVDLSKTNYNDIHKAQSWFFVDVDPHSAERILMSDGFADSSFLISFYRQRYVISFLRKGKTEHLVIRNYQKKNGQMAFALDLEKSFKNLVELTDYYMKNKSFVLSTKLSRGVGRPRRNPDNQRSRA